VVEGARLESVYRGDSIVGSNPTVSAIEKAPALGAFSMAERERPRTHRVRSRSEAQATAKPSIPPSPPKNSGMRFMALCLCHSQSLNRLPPC
jgi:hypothetical protein